MKPASLKLFVYGSLRSGFQHPAYQYISEYFDFVGAAKVKGLLFDMGEYPAAIPSNEEHYLIGELYQLKHADEFNWAIAQLDDYEGVRGEMGELPLYRRDIVNVFVGEDITEAWVYWFCGDVSGHPIVESGDVLEYRNQKYRQ